MKLFLFFFVVDCGLYSPTWIFDFESCVGVEVMIVCSVFFSSFLMLKFKIVSIENVISIVSSKQSKAPIFHKRLLDFLFWWLICSVACIHRREYLTSKKSATGVDDDCVLRIFFFAPQAPIFYFFLLQNIRKSIIVIKNIGNFYQNLIK